MALAETVEKVVAYLTRENGGDKELLVFEQVDYPKSEILVPVVSLGPNEGIEQAILREIREKSGLSLLSGRNLGRFEWFCPVALERNIRHVFHFQMSEPLESEWHHSEIQKEEGLKMLYRFYWINFKKAQFSLPVDLVSYLSLI